MAKTDYKTIDEYIGTFTEKDRELLENIRLTIAKAAPDAKEVISYQMPAFKLHGMLIWFAAWKEHISIYPKTSSIESVFASELSEYETSKGTIKFPKDKPIPFDLIAKIVTHRMEENLEKERTKRKQSKRK